MSHENAGTVVSRLLRARVPPALGGVLTDFLQILFPPTCRVCDCGVQPDADFCPDCLSDLQASYEAMLRSCPRCGHPAGNGPIPVRGDRSKTDGGAGGEGSPKAVEGCVECRSKSFAFDGCIARWIYDGSVKKAVIAAKYGSQVALADALGRYLTERILLSIRQDSSADDEQPSSDPDLVVGVPSHFWRRIQRGHGGSQVLAQTVAGELRKRGVRTRFCPMIVTTRSVKKQAWLDEGQRRKNVEGAFRLSRRWFGNGRSGRKSGPSKLAGQHVLVVDDVMTTGATANEMAKVLKKAGARRVTIAVVARAA